MLCLVSPSVTWYGLVAVKEPGTKTNARKNEGSSDGSNKAHELGDSTLGTYQVYNKRLGTAAFHQGGDA